MKFDFFFRAERSKAVLDKAGQTFDEYWAARPAFTMSAECVDASTLDQALEFAVRCGLPKGSSRGGCFEVQGPKGIWRHVKERRLIGADPSKIIFTSWEELERAEEAESAPVVAAPWTKTTITSTCRDCGDISQIFASSSVEREYQDDERCFGECAA